MRLTKGIYVEVTNARITHDGDYLRGEVTTRIVSNGNDNIRTFFFPDDYGYLVSTDDESIHSLINGIKDELRLSLVNLLDFTEEEVSRLVITLDL